jgi:hypothetical protein
MRAAREDRLRTKPVQLRRTCLVVELMGVSLRAEGHKIRESGFRLGPS